MTTHDFRSSSFDLGIPACVGSSVDPLDQLNAPPPGAVGGDGILAAELQEASAVDLVEAVSTAAHADGGDRAGRRDARAMDYATTMVGIIRFNDHPSLCAS